MSMVFAGFMNAAREDRERREDLEAEKASEDKKFEQAKYLKNMTLYNEQKLKDAAISKNARVLAEQYNLPSSALGPLAGYLGTYTTAEVSKMLSDGSLDLSSSAATPSYNVAPGDISENAKTAYNYFVAQGETPVMASGIVGNLMQESTAQLDPNIWGDNYNSFGIAQMNGPRRRALFNFAKQRGEKKPSFQTQLEYIHWEGTEGPEKKAWEQARAGSTPEDTARILSEKFWRPGEPHINNRMKHASLVYSTMLDDTAGTEQATTAMGGTGTDTMDAAFNVGGKGYSFGTEVSEDTKPDTGIKGLGFGTLVDTKQSPEEQTEEAFATPKPASGMPEIQTFSGQFNPRPVDMSKLKGDTVEDINRFIAANNGNFRPEQAEQIKRIYDLAASGAEKLGATDLAKLLGGSTSPSETIAVIEQIRLTPNLTEAQRAEGLDAANRILEQQRKDKSEESKAQGDWVSYIPFGEDGTPGNPLQVKYSNGAWRTADNTPVDENKGVTVSRDDLTDQVKIYNTQIKDINSKLQGGVQAVRDLLVLRDLVQDNPAALNPVLTKLGGITGFIKDVTSAATSLTNENGEAVYDYNTAENALMTRIEGLTEADKKIAQALLRAAYGMASMRGSSGQALSDKELAQNLAALGYGVSNPKKVMGLINSAVQNVLAASDDARVSGWEGLTMPPDVKAAMVAPLLTTKFSDFMLQTMYAEEPEMQKALVDAMADDVSYAGPDNKQDTLGDTTEESAVTDEMKAEADNLIAQYQSGETIIITPALAAVYPRYKDSIGKEATKPTDNAPKQNDDDIDYSTIPG